MTSEIDSKNRHRGRGARGRTPRLGWGAVPFVATLAWTLLGAGCADAPPSGAGFPGGDGGGEVDRLDGGGWFDGADGPRPLDASDSRGERADGPRHDRPGRTSTLHLVGAPVGAAGHAESQHFSVSGALSAPPAAMTARSPRFHLITLPAARPGVDE